MKTKVAILAVVITMCSLTLPGSLFAEKPGQGRPEVVYDSYHDASLPVREYSMEAPQGPIPREVEHPRPRRILSGAAVPVEDLAEQTCCCAASLRHDRVQLRGHSKFGQRQGSGRRSFR